MSRKKYMYINEAQSKLHSIGPKLKSNLVTAFDETNGSVSQEVQNTCDADQKLKSTRALKFWLKANSCTRCVTMLVDAKTRISAIFR